MNRYNDVLLPHRGSFVKVKKFYDTNNVQKHVLSLLALNFVVFKQQICVCVCVCVSVNSLYLEKPSEGSILFVSQEKLSTLTDSSFYRVRIFFFIFYILRPFLLNIINLS